MPGKNRYRAVRNFVRPLNRALSCVTKAIVVGSGNDPTQERHALVLNNNNPVALQVEPRLFLTVAMHYRPVKHGQHREWKVSTIAYMYGIQDRDKRELLAYHWHPRTTPEHADPHLHLYERTGSGVLSKLHLPTRRISLEEVLRFLIVELNVAPVRNDWKKILGETQKTHEKFRTWS